MNECHFLGNLTRDPELKNVGDNKQVVKFGLAVNRKFKRGDKLDQETSFLNMEAWDSGAEMINQYFKKGSPIIVHCSVKQDNWENAEGEKRSAIGFRVNKFEFVPSTKRKDEADASTEQEGPKPREAAPKKTTAKKAAPKNDSVDEDIPF